MVDKENNLERECLDDGDSDEEESAANGLLYLSAKAIEVAREGDTSGMVNLMETRCAKKLLKAYDEDSSWGLLHFSCSRGYLDIARILLDAGANPLKTVDKYGKTCLHVAIENNRQEVVAALLERHPVGMWPRRSKLTLGQVAARTGYPAAMLMLLRNGLNPNERGIRGETPLHFAARRGHVEIVQLLLEHGANVGAREDWAGRTPLHFACQAGSLQVAIALIVNGRADPHLPDLSASRHSPLETAVVSGHRTFSRRLVLFVENRRLAEERQQVAPDKTAAASREATMRETGMVRRRVSSLKGTLMAKRLLVRMEKQELLETLRGQVKKANARIRHLQTQHERLLVLENSCGSSGTRP